MATTTCTSSSHHAIAQADVFSLGATYRLLPELIGQDIRSIDSSGAKVCIDTNTTCIEVEKDRYIKNFIDFRSRTPDFFDYGGPKDQKRLLWRHGFFFLPIRQPSTGRPGEAHPMQLIQSMLIDALGNTTNLQALLDFNANYGSRLGHFVAHQGLNSKPQGTVRLADEDWPLETPVCTCGSFQKQWRYRAAFKEILGPSWTPSCKHISYMHAYEQLRNRMAQVSYQQEQSGVFKTLAYWCKPASSNESKSKLKALYIDDRASCPIGEWKVYAKEGIDGSDAWAFFHTALDHGYAIRSAAALPNLQAYLQGDRRSSETTELQKQHVTT